LANPSIDRSTGKLDDMVRAFSANQWLVFVAAMWMPQSMAVNVQAGRVVASHQPIKLAAK